MTYLFGAFRLDLAKRRLWHGEALVPLTSKAFETLALLVARAGQVVEKEDFFKIVWPDTFVEEATIAQNVSTLRKVLEDTSEPHNYIATVPRRGYRFLARVTVMETEPVVEAVSIARGSAQSGDDGQVAGASLRPSSRAPRLKVWIAVAILLALVGFGMRSRRDAAVALAPAVVFAIAPPEGASFSAAGSFMALSPDGQHVAFLALNAAGIPQLWLRPLNSMTAHVLQDTDGASQPFWSPDGRFVAFYTKGKLMKVAVPFGPVQVVGTIPDELEPLAGTWNHDGDILFSAVRQGIWRMPRTAGTATLIMPDDRILEHAGWPQFLPDGRHFLYAVASSQPDRAGLYVASLDSTVGHRVLATRSFGLYVSSGHLLFVQRGALVAQAFDVDKMQVTGNPVPIAEGVTFNPGTGRGSFSVSQNGVVAFRPVTETELVWFDRRGNELGTLGSRGVHLQFALSRDDSRVAVARLDPRTWTSDIWIADVATGDARRLTFDDSWETSPLWSRDGSRVIFNSDRQGQWDLYEKLATGEGTERHMLTADNSVLPMDWLSDGRILFQQSDGASSGHFSLLTEANDITTVRLPQSEPYEKSGRISPDDQWLAYVGYEYGRSIYVRPLQSTESRWQVSVDGGDEPKWRGDGRELFYLSPDLALMAAQIEPSSTFRPLSVQRLFQTRAVAPISFTGQAYEVTSDGQRFLLKIPVSPSQIRVIVNWTAALRRVH